MRLPARGKIAGVCAGLADYLDADVTFVRVAWVVFSMVPGAIVGGVIAYLVSWLIMPLDPSAAVTPVGSRRLVRSGLDHKIAGVCGGIAEYFEVDPTVVRVLWVILTLVPGAIVFGVIAYIGAWIVMPAPQAGLQQVRQAS